MKKCILIIGLITITIVGFAQQKVDTIKRYNPVPAQVSDFKPDIKKVYDFSFKGNFEEISGLQFAIDNGTPLIDSTDYNSHLRNEVKAYNKSVYNQLLKTLKTYSDQQQADRNKFVADSLKNLKKL